MNVATTDAEEISLTELTAFAGDEDMARLWQKHLHRETKLAGFNIWAAIFAAPWFFYRKLNQKGLIALLLETIIPVVVIAAIMLVTGVDSDTVAYLSWALAFVGVRIGFGWWANIALCKKAVVEIRGIDKLNFDNDMHLQYITAAGGVNFLAFLIAAFLIGMLNVILGGQI